ncbi:thioredoxin domain-containing protein [Shewanella sp. Isolate8]|uniref:DsbA family protein n=1 Tax=Shewanella sp. Isolate8 TaxID=2908529 RepID=UPI001EFCD145|nr:thioredoxin domain-containing protein [Shewanella sp. Isolate8]MCG9746164.1 DsbA family protein [Shewanella sp. Isolate8]
MPSTHSTVIVCLSLLFFAAACQQTNDDKQEQEIAYLKQEVGQLQQQVAIMGSQIKEIHTVVMRGQKLQHRNLPTQNNPAEDGKLPSIGKATARIAIIEFSDFQCPYCKRYMDNTFTKIKSDYIDTGKVKYIARDFPLGFHPKAKGAAIAANCSLQQDAYWPMRDALFKNMRQLGDKLYQDTATQLSLDMTKFAACLKDQAIMNKIKQDISYGSSVGVRGTPSFLIGRLENNRLLKPKLLTGAQSFDVFKASIDALEPSPQAN